MRYQLQRSQQLNSEIDTVWEFFSSPLNLSRLTPPDLQFTLSGNRYEGNIYEGMIIDYKLTPVLNIPIGWQTEIVQVDHRKSFTDFQRKGPYKSWRHFHEFISHGGGVLMKDVVDYEMPLGILGTIVRSLFVQAKLERIFDYRYQVLQRLFNSSI